MNTRTFVICFAVMMASVSSLMADVGATLDQTLAAIDAGRPYETLRLLGRAARAGPRNADVHLLYAHVLNNLGHGAAALTRLEMVRRFGDVSPQWHAERGRALLSLGRYDEAANALAHAPPTATNLIAHATVLIQLRRADEALPLLDQTMRADDAVGPQVRLLRARALASLNRDDEAQQEVRAGRAAAKGTGWEPVFDRIGARLEAMAPPDAPDWGAQFTLGVGYNDNVVLRPDEVSGTPPAEFSDESGPMFTQSLSAWTRLIGDANTGAIARAGLSGAQYPDQDDFNQFYLNGGVLAYHSVDNLQLELGVDLGYTSVDGDTYANTAGASATVRWRQNERTRSNLAYRYTWREFDFDVLAEEDRDGSLHVVTFIQDVFVPINERTLHLMPYVEVGIEDTDGASSQNDFWGAALRGRIALNDHLSLFGGLSYRDRDYDNPHIRSGFTTRRDDELWQFGGGVQYAVNDETRLTFAYQHLDNDSNLPTLFAYEQNTVMVAITFLFGP